MNSSNRQSRKGKRDPSLIGPVTHRLRIRRTQLQPRCSIILRWILLQLPIICFSTLTSCASIEFSFSVLSRPWQLAVPLPSAKLFCPRRPLPFRRPGELLVELPSRKLSVLLFSACHLPVVLPDPATESSSWNVFRGCYRLPRVWASLAQVLVV